MPLKTNDVDRNSECRLTGKTPCERKEFLSSLLLDSVQASISIADILQALWTNRGGASNGFAPTFISVKVHQLSVAYWILEHWRFLSPFLSEADSLWNHRFHTPIQKVGRPLNFKPWRNIKDGSHWNYNHTSFSAVQRRATESQYLSKMKLVRADKSKIP